VEITSSGAAGGTPCRRGQRLADSPDLSRGTCDRVVVAAPGAEPSDVDDA